jgi:hypothetical protein
VLAEELALLVQDVPDDFLPEGFKRLALARRRAIEAREVGKIGG